VNTGTVNKNVEALRRVCYKLKTKDMNYITYGIDLDTGLVISRMNRKHGEDEVAIPVLVWESEKGDKELTYETRYLLEKFGIYESLPNMTIKWTKKISKHLKNEHRRFWGMKPLK